MMSDLAITIVALMIIGGVTSMILGVAEIIDSGSRKKILLFFILGIAFTALGALIKPLVI